MAMPGRQVPFASREMPVARGWGSGGLQITLATVGPDDVVKVIDQGDDASLNAALMRELIRSTAGVAVTSRTQEATLVQSRHRIPEVPMRGDQILILQLPHPEPLRRTVSDPAVAAQLHADADYTQAWVDIYDQEVRYDGPLTGADHPVVVNDCALMSPSPIPKFDVLRLDRPRHPILFGAGRRAAVTALRPGCRVTPLAFLDRPLRSESMAEACALCGRQTGYRVRDAGEPPLTVCSDVDACRARLDGEVP
jgi:alpha-D-ribose 1-methylphosphonate 5-phosphate C-P lyase